MRCVPTCLESRAGPSVHRPAAAPHQLARWTTRHHASQASRHLSDAAQARGAHTGGMDSSAVPSQRPGGQPVLASTSPSHCHGSLDGTGAGDHDRPYRFGRRPRSSAPFPFSTRQYVRLLVLRSRLEAGLLGADDRAANQEDAS